MRNRQEIENSVKDFVALELSTKHERPQNTTRLRHDLRIDGDDAAELMEAFGERFEVDLTNFDFDLHFGPELAFNPFLFFFWRGSKPQKFNFVPITIDDLVEAAVRGEWRTPLHPLL